MIVIPTPGCLVCHKPIESIKGKRQRKYCSDSCRQKAYQSANKVEIVSITKVEYDRLVAVAGYWNSRMNDMSEAIKNNPPSIIISTSSNEPNLNDLKTNEVNTKQKKIKGKDEAVLKPERIKTTALDVKCPPMGLSKTELAVWRRNNG